jgi:hypothetical protein
VLRSREAECCDDRREEHETHHSSPGIKVSASASASTPTARRRCSLRRSTREAREEAEEYRSAATGRPVYLHAHWTALSRPLRRQPFWTVRRQGCDVFVPNILVHLFHRYHAVVGPLLENGSGPSDGVFVASCRPDVILVVRFQPIRGFDHNLGRHRGCPSSHPFPLGSAQHLAGYPNGMLRQPKIDRLKHS